MALQAASVEGLAKVRGLVRRGHLPLHRPRWCADLRGPIVFVYFPNAEKGIRSGRRRSWSCDLPWSCFLLFQMVHSGCRSYEGCDSTCRNREAFRRRFTGYFRMRGISFHRLTGHSMCWYYLQHEGRPTARRAPCRRRERLRETGRMAPQRRTSGRRTRFQIPVGARGRWKMRPALRQRVRERRSPAHRKEGIALRLHNPAGVTGRFLERSRPMEVLTCGRLSWKSHRAKP